MNPILSHADIVEAVRSSLGGASYLLSPGNLQTSFLIGQNKDGEVTMTEIMVRSDSSPFSTDTTIYVDGVPRVGIVRHSCNAWAVNFTVRGVLREHLGEIK